MLAPQFRVTPGGSPAHRLAACAISPLAGDFFVASGLRHGGIVGDISVVPTGQFFFYSRLAIRRQRHARRKEPLQQEKRRADPEEARSSHMAKNSRGRGGKRKERKIGSRGLWKLSATPSALVKGEYARPDHDLSDSGGQQRERDRGREKAMGDFIIVIVMFY